jgi:Domain of unknown function (DUF4124)
MNTIHYASTLVRKTISLLVLLSICTTASAEVFKCVDKATGKMSFTDKACPNSQPGSHQAVSSTNGDSGYNGQAVAAAKERRELDQEKFRDDWQSHNTDVSSKQASEKAKRDRERAKNQWEWDHRENSNNGYDGRYDHHGRSYQTTRATRAK